MFKNKEHLSITGIGPLFFGFLVLWTLTLFVVAIIIQAIGRGDLSELAQLSFIDISMLKNFLYDCWLSWNFLPLTDQASNVSLSLVYSYPDAIALILLFMVDSIIATFLFIFGFTMWFRAIFKCRMVHSIRTNSLMTNDVYAYTRNPVYAALLFISTSIVLCTVGFVMATAYIIVAWVVLTILLINTEEKWLKKVYKDEYLQYCQRVNRIFPKLFV